MAPGCSARPSGALAAAALTASVRRAQLRECRLRPCLRAPPPEQRPRGLSLQHLVDPEQVEALAAAQGEPKEPPLPRTPPHPVVLRLLQLVDVLAQQRPRSARLDPQHTSMSPACENCFVFNSSANSSSSTSGPCATWRGASAAGHTCWGGPPASSRRRRGAGMPARASERLLQEAPAPLSVLLRRVFCWRVHELPQRCLYVPV